MNKKAEGRISSLFMASICVVSIFVIISTLNVEMVGSWGRPDIPEFEAYSTVYNNMTDLTTDLVKSQNANLEPATQDFDRFEDNIFRRGLRTITKFPEIMNFALQSASISIQQLKFEVPAQVQFLIFTTGAALIIILAVTAYWRWKL